jgi:hypothetical protein
MNGYEIYRQLKLGARASLTFQGKTDDLQAWSAFGAKVAALRTMHAEGLLRIDREHTEAQSGAFHIDMVVFTRLA